MWRPFAWWNGLRRQKRTGWLIIAVSMFYILYFLKGRLLAPGGPIADKEWVYFVAVVRRHHARHHQHPHGRDARAQAAARCRWSIPIGVPRK